MEYNFRRNTRFEILTPNGFKNFEGVLLTKHQKYFKITTQSEVLYCSSDHKLKTLNGFKKISEFQPNDVLQISNRFEEIFNIQLISDTKDINFYDPVNVEGGYEYLSNNIVSHNCVEFLGSSGTLIAGWKLKQLSTSWLQPRFSKDDVHIFTEPKKNRKYVLVADVSEGKGLDYSAFHVIDVSEAPFDEVCVYRSNIITPIEYADVILRLAKYYNNASVLVELNSIGTQVCSILWDDYLYDNMIHTQSAGPNGKQVSGGFSEKKTEIGIRTTKSVKGTGCSLLKMLIEQGKLNIHHEQTVYELSRFSRKGKSWEAEDGATDDLVMPLVLFAWLTDQEYFKDLTDISILNKLRDRSEKQMMEELAPFAVINYGDDDSAKTHELLGDNKEGWVLNNTDPPIKIYF